MWSRYCDPFSVSYLTYWLYYVDSFLLLKYVIFQLLVLCIFFPKHKLFILVTMALYKTFCKNVIWRGLLVILLPIILQPSLYCIGHLENQQNLVLWFIRFSVLYKEAILGGMYSQYLQSEVLKNRISWGAQLVST